MTALDYKTALEQIGNILGRPVPGYYGSETQLELTQDKVNDAADIVRDALVGKP